MKSHGERLMQRSRIRAHGGRQGQHVGRWQVHCVAEESGIGSRTEKPQIGAHIVMAAPAILAVIAVNGRFQRHRIAALPTSNARATSQNGPHRFVPQYHGVHGLGIADRALGEIVQVRPTNADGLHRDLNLSRRGIGQRFLADLKSSKAYQFRDGQTL